MIRLSLVLIYIQRLEHSAGYTYRTATYGLTGNCEVCVVDDAYII